MSWRQCVFMPWKDLYVSKSSSFSLRRTKVPDPFLVILHMVFYMYLEEFDAIALENANLSVTKEPSDCRQPTWTHFAWWRHQMETFSTLLALCEENSLVTGEFPSQRPVMRSFDVFFICASITGWVINREAGDLRRHGAHYDVTVMVSTMIADDLLPIWHEEPLLLTLINFNPIVDKQSNAQQSVRLNYLSIPKLQWLHRWSSGMDK